MGLLYWRPPPSIRRQSSPYTKYAPPPLSRPRPPAAVRRPPTLCRGVHVHRGVVPARFYGARFAQAAPAHGSFLHLRSRPPPTDLVAVSPAAPYTMDTSLSPKELDVQRMLACEVHIGTRNVDFQMERYVWRRRADGACRSDHSPRRSVQPSRKAPRS